jgi:hypothetical protein
MDKNEVESILNFYLIDEHTQKELTYLFSRSRTSIKRVIDYYKGLPVRDGLSKSVRDFIDNEYEINNEERITPPFPKSSEVFVTTLIKKPIISVVPKGFFKDLPDSIRESLWNKCGDIIKENIEKWKKSLEVDLK